MSCSNIFTTHEAADLTSGVMVSYTGTKDLLPLHKERLLISVYECCKHRQSSVGDATQLTATILSRLRPLMSTGKIQRNQIVATTIQILKNFDKAAATMYEAYHPIA